MDNQNNYFLKVTNLKVQLQNEIILENVHFQIEKGTILAIVGPNGAGKSMLFRTLLNLVPYTGEIKWGETAKIGYVPQNVTVKDIPISVKEFLSIKKESDLKEVFAAVKLELDVLNKTLSILSGGQLRRVLVAWALLDNPNVLLFDEPTVGVDIGGEESIFATMRDLKLKNNMTILLITHDIHLVKEYTDKLLGLNKCTTFFGDSQRIGEPALQQKIYGETVCLASSESESHD